MRHPIRSTLQSPPFTGVLLVALQTMGVGLLQVRSSQAKTSVKILGIEFFQGPAAEAVRLMARGGLLVVPGAPALKNLPLHAAYREALSNADLAITDSSFMILIWLLLRFQWISRLSGPQYLRCLLEQPDVREPGNTLWVMANPASAGRHLDWLATQGIQVPPAMVYMAPMYGPTISDPVLLERLEAARPQHVIVTIGGGRQEILGLLLKRNLTYRPSIHCIGAAIAMLSGDQVRMPHWADSAYLGWLLRSLSDPKTFVPRYWDARKLFGLMLRYRDRLPDLEIHP